MAKQQYEVTRPDGSTYITKRPPRPAGPGPTPSPEMSGQMPFGDPGFDAPPAAHEDDIFPQMGLASEAVFGGPVSGPLFADEYGGAPGAQGSPEGPDGRFYAAEPQMQPAMQMQPGGPNFGDLNGDNLQIFNAVVSLAKEAMVTGTQRTELATRGVSSGPRQLAVESQQHSTEVQDYPRPGPIQQTHKKGRAPALITDTQQESLWSRLSRKQRALGIGAVALGSVLILGVLNNGGHSAEDSKGTDTSAAAAPNAAAKPQEVIKSLDYRGMPANKCILAAQFVSHGVARPNVEFTDARGKKRLYPGTGPFEKFRKRSHVRLDNIVTVGVCQDTKKPNAVSFPKKASETGGVLVANVNLDNTYLLAESDRKFHTFIPPRGLAPKDKKLQKLMKAKQRNYILKKVDSKTVGAHDQFAIEALTAETFTIDAKKHDALKAAAARVLIENAEADVINQQASITKDKRVHVDQSHYTVLGDTARPQTNWEKAKKTYHLSNLFGNANRLYFSDGIVLDGIENSITMKGTN